MITIYSDVFGFSCTKNFMVLWSNKCLYQLIDLYGITDGIILDMFNLV